MRYENIGIAVPGQMEGPAQLTAYLLDPVSTEQDRKRPAVIVVPGGGYWNRSDREQEPIAMQFLAMGCHSFILNYSVAPHRFPVSLLELAAAVALVREHAAGWSVDDGGILVCGFSAGGHLTCSLGTFWNKPFVCDAIGKEPWQIRPNGLILSYPVITSGPYRHTGSMEKLLGDNPDTGLLTQVSLELQVTEEMPPVFLWHTVTDESVPVENSLLLAGAMRKSGVNFELHIFPSGCHGVALANRETGGDQKRLIEPCCQSWISLVQSWIETICELNK